MLGRWSLQRRLIAGILALLTLATLGIGLISTVALRSSLVAQLDEELRQTAARVEFAVGSRPADPRLGFAPGLPVGSLIAFVGESGRVSAAYLDDEAQVQRLSQLQLRMLADTTLEHPRTIRFPGIGGEFRVLATELPGGTTLLVGLSTQEVVVTTSRLGAVITIILVGTLAVAALLGRSVVRFALTPLTRIRQTATEIASLPLDRGEVDLRGRVAAIEADADPETEVGQLGGAFSRMIEHVQRSLDAREASEQKVRRFVADASHELRTPLAAIRGYSELTRRGGHELPDDVRHALSRIESESVRMSGLVDDLLLLARLDEGRQLAREAVDLGRLVVDITADARAASPDHDWVVRVPESPVVVLGDQPRLHQAIANLLANARVHTPAGTQVTAALGVLDGFAIVTVTDTGPGIPPEVQPVLFERFARADTSRSRATGSTGLGLAITAAIVRAHDGAVDAVSEPGQTVFRVRLPLAPDA
ncbi:two-component system OmpR family sensor kinase [Microcella putealis]|uniref:histidine kinase n=1 Tax=Microcella putealis TaxID=337005 RepID=A0A4Q7LMF4_9MICO|nr:ATP-binding protein [Microcella putealis]RZS55117.1 two-component system OmpR family sensor kinase [Microcella putealis]TQM23621.1 two-component system OmpR family sensor kinase [Microcella putealis]